MNNRRYWVNPGYHSNNSGQSTGKPVYNRFGVYSSLQQPQNKYATKKGGCACGGPKIVKGK